PTKFSQSMSTHKRWSSTPGPKYATSANLLSEPDLGGDPLLRSALTSEPKDFPDFDYGDLAIHPRLLVPDAAQNRRPRTGDLYRAVRRKGKGFEKRHSRGEKGFENVVKIGFLRFENRSTGEPTGTGTPIVSINPIYRGIRNTTSHPGETEF